jgi:hypothetical protein
MRRLGLTLACAAGVAGASIGAASTASAAICLPPPETTSEATPSTTLLSAIGVLRRPKTTSDVLPPLGPGAPSFGRALGEGIYVNYVRLARVVAGTSFYVVPVAKGTGLHCTTHEGVGLVTTNAIGTGAGGVETVSELRSKGLGASDWLDGNGVEYGIVPDGVAKVTLRYPGRPRRHSSVTVPVIENVFVANVPHALPGHRVSVEPSLVVWRAKNGRTLNTLRPGIRVR